MKPSKNPSGQALVMKLSWSSAPLLHPTGPMKVADMAIDALPLADRVGPLTTRAAILMIRERNGEPPCAHMGTASANAHVALHDH